MMPLSDKATLRKVLGQILAEQDATTTRTASAAIQKRVFELPEIQQAQTILSCLSFGHEVDTWPLIDRLLARGQKILVPRAEPRDMSLHAHPYPCALTRLSFGLQQPPRGTPEVPLAELNETIDVVLVLGLGFDHRGYRLGYGNGYFDRFLASRPFPTVALSFDCQIVEALPVDPHDVPMNVVVTERGSWITDRV